MVSHGCCGEAHGEVVADLKSVIKAQEATAAELKAHQKNGDTGHVQRGEVETLKKDVGELKDCVNELTTSQKVSASVRTMWGAIIVAVLTTGGQVALAIVNHAAK